MSASAVRDDLGDIMPAYWLSPQWRRRLFQARLYRGRELKREKLCREALEDLLNIRFHKVRPDWLRNPETGRPLELDGFNPCAGIAFEFDGDGHDVDERQKRKDSVKDQICAEIGVVLIRIPHRAVENDKRVKERIYEFVRSALVDAGWNGFPFTNLDPDGNSVHCPWRTAPGSAVVGENASRASSS